MRVVPYWPCKSLTSILMEQRQYSNQTNTFIIRSTPFIHFLYMNTSLSQRSSNPLQDQDGIQNFFSRTLIRLQSRVESVELKIVSLSKIVRLLQQYSEKKDQQYEKQASNLQQFHSKISKLQQLEQLTLRFSQITLNVQNHSLRLEQINRVVQQKQKSIKETEERLSYEISEVSQRIQKLEFGILQQIREGSKGDKVNQNKSQSNYILEELTFKVAQLQHNHKADYEKVNKKIAKLQPKTYSKENTEENSYGISHLDRQKSTRKKSNSALKHYKSK